MKPQYSSDFVGNINYGAKVIDSIISLATLEIRGIESLQGKKVNIEKNGDILNIDVFVKVSYTVACSEVACKVQENIKRSVESMTNYKTNVINVNVLSVSFDD